jgi:flagellar biosynthesis repressor protein FlbT
MGLRISLKPWERLLVNGALIQNSDRKTDLYIETRCRFLRESEIIRESEVDTPCKQLWLTLQVLHLAEDPEAPHALLFRQATDLMTTMPSAAPYIAEISRALEEGATHKALKAVKLLVQHEREATQGCGEKAGAA